jgi:hypothetical protein
MTEKKLGKIEKVHYGLCGYDDCMLGLKVTIGGNGWGVGADKAGHWIFEPSEHSKWTKEDQIKALGENALFISKLLTEAKVSSVDKLSGIPVECTFEGMLLKDWRILTEVL